MPWGDASNVISWRRCQLSATTPRWRAELALPGRVTPPVCVQEADSRPAEQVTTSASGLRPTPP